MRNLLNRKHKGNPSIIKMLLLCLMLVLGTSLVSCGSSDTQQEVDEETQEILDDMEDNTLSDEEIASAFEDELVPLDEDEQDLMENSSGDASLEDDEMTALNESDMEDEEDSSDGSGGGIQVTEDGTYTSKDEVAVYIHQFGHLPSNYITKNEARDLGWESSEGNLDEVAPGMSIGGDVFGNYEGMLPEEDGRTYRECDIGFDGGYRNSKRIIYSNDGLIFYTGDHYETFEQLY